MGPVLRPSGGPGPAGEAGVGALLPQPAGDGRSEARSRRAHLPGTPAQPEHLQLLRHSTGSQEGGRGGCYLGVQL